MICMLNAHYQRWNDRAPLGRNALVHQPFLPGICKRGGLPHHRGLYRTLAGDGGRREWGARDDALSARGGFDLMTRVVTHIEGGRRVHR